MRTHSTNHRAFSLLELLAVILIIGIVAVFVTPAVATILKGSQVSQAEQILVDQIKNARQSALTKNRSIEVRFIRFGDPEVPGEKKDTPSSGAFRAIQILEVLDSGALVALDKPQVLPQATIFSPGGLSTLLSDPRLPVTQAKQLRTGETGGDPGMPRGVDWQYEYVAFRFLRDGSTNLAAVGGTKWCVTVHNINEKVAGTVLPPNFITLQIDPVSGAVRVYRPTAA
jgi:uncharacterized protein (TIGR02596 family)